MSENEVESTATEPVVGSAAGSSGFRHYPALDGVRGIAVAAVLVFHGGFEVASGGFLGVSTFFTLSGFLITSLLLAEKAGTGTIALGAFWKRRFKRLLPAAVACIGAIAVFWSWLDLQREAEFTGVDVVSRIPGDLLAALAYVYNWRAAFPPEGAGYDALFAEVVEPSPAAHFWSLSIEEQFYVVFPLLAAVVLAYLAWSRRAFGTVLVGLLVLSLLSLTWLDGFDRIYNGTDVRAAEILVGALLAVVFSTPRAQRVITEHRAVAVAGVPALIAIIWLWNDTSLSSGWLLDGGLFVYALLSAAVIMAATQARGPVATGLSWRPLVWLGAVSYGVYLYHWPIYRWVDEDATGLDPVPLFVLRVAITLGVSWLSFHYLEQPIRRGTRPGHGIPTPWLAVGATAAVVVALGLAYSDLGRTDAPEVAFGSDDDISLLDDPTSSTSATSAPDTTSTAPGQRAATSTTAPPVTTTVAPLELAERPPVITVIGDSVGVNLRGGLDRRAEALGTPPLVARDLAFAGCATTYGSGEIRWSDGIRPTCRTSYEPVRESLDGAGADVAVVFGSTVDLLPYRQAPDAPFTDPTDPDNRARLDARLRELQTLVLDRGMSVVWVTVPCIEEDKAASLGIDPGTVEIQNDLIREIAADGPSNVALYDLHEAVCPGGEFVRELAGDPDAREDGLHFSEGVADILAKELGEVIDRVAPVAAA